MTNMRWNRASGQPELLCPAGDRQRMEAAIRFGADAVYLAGKQFGMRSGPANFGPEELAGAVECAHAAGVRIYLTCNSLMRNSDCEALPDFLREVQRTGVDAVIVTDFAVLGMLKKFVPELEIHISTQAGVANWAAAEEFYNLGAKRVVLARELPLEDIAEIRAKVPAELELEAFVHGSMCVSFSGRCLLSEFMTSGQRDGDRGDCAQPCRWKYALVEEKRPGAYFPICDTEKGTYILNSRDLCMIEHVPELLKAGVTSLKIEGRAKSAYYTAVTANAYRHALDAALLHKDEPLPAWIPEEMNRISHRRYSTGFFFGGTPGQVYEGGSYIRGWEEIAVSEGEKDGFTQLAQRNRFFRGDTASVLEPGKAPYDVVLNEIFGEDGVPLKTANHAEMTVLLRTERPIPAGAILRKQME